MRQLGGLGGELNASDGNQQCSANMCWLGFVDWAPALTCLLGRELKKQTIVNKYKVDVILPKLTYATYGQVRISKEGPNISIVPLAGDVSTESLGTDRARITISIAQAILRAVDYGLLVKEDADNFLDYTFPQYACGDRGRTVIPMINRFISGAASQAVKLSPLGKQLTLGEASPLQGSVPCNRTSTVLYAVMNMHGLDMSCYWRAQATIVNLPIEYWAMLEVTFIRILEISTDAKDLRVEEGVVVPRLPTSYCATLTRSIVRQLVESKYDMFESTKYLQQELPEGKVWYLRNMWWLCPICYRSWLTNTGGRGQTLGRQKSDGVFRLNTAQIMNNLMRAPGNHPIECPEDHPACTEARKLPRARTYLPSPNLIVSAHFNVGSELPTTCEDPYTPINLGHHQKTERGYPRCEAASVTSHVRLNVPKGKRVSRAALKALNNLFPPTSKADNHHMTIHLAQLVFNHLNYNPLPQQLPSLKSLLSELTLPNKVAQLNRVLRYIPIGTNQVLTTAMIILSVASDELAQLIRDNILVPRTLMDEPFTQKERLKEMSLLYRKCAVDMAGSFLQPKEVGQLAYYELAFGRSNNVTDWQTEKANRCGQTIHIQDAAALEFAADTSSFTWLPDHELLAPSRGNASKEYYAKLKKAIAEMVKVLVPSKGQVRETLQQFYKRRHEWMSSGASGGYKVEARIRQDGEMSDQSVRAGKRAWAEATPVSSIYAALNEPRPKEVAKGSEKYENGKARAIYGVEPLHYTINTYATKGLEERLVRVPGLEKGASALNAAALEFHRTRITQDSAQHCTMLDFADFNRHHTPRAQAIIFESLAERGEEIGASRDWIRANKWTARSKDNMWATFAELGQFKVNQGMFSGTRSTDLINTILNLAYFKVAQDFVSQEYGVEASDLYHVHQGDDVWISNTNTLWPRLIFYTMQRQGFLFSQPKQMFGQGRGEYLRVLYQKGTAHGYLARALVNYILRPIQNDIQLPPASWASTITDSAATLTRRGLSKYTVSLLWDEGVKHWVKVLAHSKDQKPIPVPLSVITSHTILNGFGCPPPFTQQSSQYVQLPPLPVPRAPEAAALADLPELMARDWVAHVSSKTVGGNKNLDAETLVTAIKRDNYSDVLPKMVSHHTSKEYKLRFAKYVDQVGNIIKKRVRKEATDPHAVAGIPNLQPLQTGCGPFFGLETLKRDGAAFFTDPLISSNLAATTGPVEFIKHELKPYNPLQTLIQQAVTTSQFKSLSLTSLALGLNRADAMTHIANELSERGRLSEDIRYALFDARRYENPLFYEVLNQASFPNVQVMKYSSNSGLTQYLGSATCSAVLQIMASHNIRDPAVLAARLDAHFARLVANAHNSAIFQATILY